MILMQVGLLTAGYITGMYVSKKYANIDTEEYLFYSAIFTMMSSGLIVLNKIFDEPTHLHKK